VRNSFICVALLVFALLLPGCAINRAIVDTSQSAVKGVANALNLPRTGTGFAKCSTVPGLVGNVTRIVSWEAFRVDPGSCEGPLAFSFKALKKGEKLAKIVPGKRVKIRLEPKDGSGIRTGYVR